MTTTERAALAEGKRIAKADPNITAVSLGFKIVNGIRTDERAVVFTVKEKKPIAMLSSAERIPQRLPTPSGASVQTDVVEGEFTALALTSRQRPCPGGYSIGHFRITAGTFGLVVRRGASGERYILSNNHVLAESNGGSPGDLILQPGPHDGGQHPGDRIAQLTDYATINWVGGGGLPPKKRLPAKVYWAVVKATAGVGPRLTGCPYRLSVRPQAIEQPSPNLVDAAIARPFVDEDVLDEVSEMGAPVGVRDFQLGDLARKTGRTTGHTKLRCDGEDGLVRVSYGTGKIAEFDHQVMFRERDGGEGSAGGDSGSSIWHDPDSFVGALLYAGGDGQTWANRMSDVCALLGVRV